MKSTLSIEEVDATALGLYLGILYQDRRKELVQLGLDKVVQKRKNPKAKKILISTEEVLEPGQRQFLSFTHQSGSQVGNRRSL